MKNFRCYHHDDLYHDARVRDYDYDGYFCWWFHGIFQLLTTFENPMNYLVDRNHLILLVRSKADFFCCSQLYLL